MSIIAFSIAYQNVILALELAVAIKLKQNFTNTEPDSERPPVWERDDLTNAQRKKLKSVYAGKFKNATVAGTEYAVLNFYFPDIPVSDTDLKLLWLERLKELLPGKEFVLGAWGADGAEYGTTITRRPNGSIAITGTPVYPIHARILDIMPDDVTYDEDGNETGRTPATAPKQVHKIAGWADRRWS